MHITVFNSDAHWELGLDGLLGLELKLTNHYQGNQHFFLSRPTSSSVRHPTLGWHALMGNYTRYQRRMETCACFSLRSCSNWIGCWSCKVKEAWENIFCNIFCIYSEFNLFCSYNTTFKLTHFCLFSFKLTKNKIHILLLSKLMKIVIGLLTFC